MGCRAAGGRGGGERSPAFCWVPGCLVVVANGPPGLPCSRGGHSEEPGLSSEMQGDVYWKLLGNVLSSLIREGM